MKIKRAGRGILSSLIPVLAAAVLSSAGGPVSPGQIVVPPPADLSGYALPPKDAHPKIDSALWALTPAHLRVQTGSGVERAAAGGTGRLIRIVAETDGAHGGDSRADETGSVCRRIEALGGAVERTSGRFVQALLPPDVIETFASFRDISRLRLPSVPRAASILSEGVARSGAFSWFNLASYRSSANPVKIAVLDLGFAGYSALLGVELPADVTVRSFRTDGDIEAGTSHGAACAEIIHDMAPDARIYLINFETDVEQHAAVDYLIAEKIDVVSYSLVWPGAGAGNGTGPICEDVKKCAAQDILWVSAAGDDAQSHWKGTFADANGDSFQEFASDDEILQWPVPAGTWTRATLTWDDWGTWNGTSYEAPTQDFDLVLWRWTGTAWEFLEYCDDWQTGETGQKPFEQSSLWKTNVATYYGVSILRWDASENRVLDLIVQGNSNVIEYVVPGGSIGIPADAAEAIAVGATDAETDVLQAWSSQGPASDGRMKPDLTAFSRVSTAVLGSKAFSGTSAAAPHVAGALGLLMAKTPFTADQLRTILEERAKDLGITGPDNFFGYGRLNLYKKKAF
ncbi:MAG: S8 family serine peptidase [Candidatus Aminicenantes bacterium]|nr:S8 family serine peptidase [Candidatus Aminicenantes bacterium]